MELEFETRTTDYLRQSIEGVCRQEQTLEVIVPDASPDARSIAEQMIAAEQRLSRDLQSYL